MSQPNSGDLWDRSLALLLHGDYENGWPRHDWIRTGDPASKEGYRSTPTFGRPIWRGEDTAHLLINADFGMGDTIQFFRFVEPVLTKAWKVSLRCHSDLGTLFQGNLWMDIVGFDSTLPEFGSVIHMMALPELLGVGGNFSGKPYLVPNKREPPQPAMEFMSQLNFWKIGICWAGNPFNPRQHLRRIPRDLMKKLVVVPGMRFFSLCKTDEYDYSYMIDMGRLMRDWNETAHLLTHLDLVITVDTAMAHLAGAMGRPVWLLLSDQDPDWRWGLEGSTTPWYDSMCIFRRTSTWDELMDRVAAELMNLIERTNEDDAASNTEASQASGS